MNQDSKNKKNIHTILKLAILVVLLVGAIGVQAWIGRPSGAPTNCPDDHTGCNYPLTLGSDAQAKKGRLVVGTSAVPTDINDSFVVNGLAAVDILSVWGKSILASTGSTVTIGSEDAPRMLYVYGNMYVQSIASNAGTVPVCAEQTGRLVQCPAASIPPSVDLKVATSAGGTYVDAGKAFVVDRPGFATWAGVASVDKTLYMKLDTTNVTSCTFAHDLLNSTSDTNSGWTSLAGTTFSGQPVTLQAFGLNKYIVTCTGNDGNEYSDSATIAVTGSKVYNANSSFTVPSNVVTLTMAAGGAGGGGGGGADGGESGGNGGDSCVIPGSSGSCGGTEIIRAEGGKGGFEGGGSGANSPVGAGGSGYPGTGVTVVAGNPGNSNNVKIGGTGGNGGATGGVTAGKGGKGFTYTSDPQKNNFSGAAGGGGGAAVSRTMTVVPATAYYAVIGSGGSPGILGNADEGTAGTAGAKGSVFFSW